LSSTPSNSQTSLPFSVSPTSFKTPSPSALTTIASSISPTVSQKPAEAVSSSSQSSGTVSLSLTNIIIIVILIAAAIPLCVLFIYLRSKQVELAKREQQVAINEWIYNTPQAGDIKIEENPFHTREEAKI
jgi:hypothetical protein